MVDVPAVNVPAVHDHDVQLIVLAPGERVLRADDEAKAAQFAVAVTVTVADPELASSVTESEAVGTLAPPEPPDVAAQ